LTRSLAPRALRGQRLLPSLRRRYGQQAVPPHGTFVAAAVADGGPAVYAAWTKDGGNCAEDVPRDEVPGA
jgi:hypothetical protein